MAKPGRQDGYEPLYPHRGAQRVGELCRYCTAQPNPTRIEHMGPGFISSLIPSKGLVTQTVGEVDCTAMIRLDWDSSDRFWPAGWVGCDCEHMENARRPPHRRRVSAAGRFCFWPGCSPPPVSATTFKSIYSEPFTLFGLQGQTASPLRRRASNSSSPPFGRAGQSSSPRSKGSSSSSPRVAD